MDDDWGLQAIVRGCSASLSAATSLLPAAATTTTTTTTTTSSNTFTSDLDFQSFTTTTTTTNNNNNYNNSSSFLFSPFNYRSQSSVGSGQPFSFSSSDPIMMRPQQRSTSNNHVVVEDLHELYKPFFVTKSEPPNSSSSSTSSQVVLPSNSIIATSSNDQIRPLKHVLKQSHVSSSTPRSKKRKNQLKKVCQVPAESLSSDVWAWRKYGQKPIKGSPYPRGYYRCSSSKGCLARKQVERNRSDPGMFIVTYTCEHNHPAPTHRNSLAGSTRHKPSPPTTTTSTDDPSNPSPESTAAGKPSSPASSPEDDLAAAALSGSATESREGPESSTMLMDDEEDDEFGFSADMAVSDDFFVGLEGLGAPAPSPATGDFFPDNFPANFGLPWSVSSTAAAAGGR